MKQLEELMFMSRKKRIETKFMIRDYLWQFHLTGKLGNNGYARLFYKLELDETWDAILP